MHKGVTRPQNRNTYKITLLPDEEKAIDTIIARSGMAKVEFVRRVISWIARQPDAVRQAILGTLVDGADDVIGGMLADLAAQVRKGTNIAVISRGEATTTATGSDDTGNNRKRGPSDDPPRRRKP